MILINASVIWIMVVLTEGYVYIYRFLFVHVNIDFYTLSFCTLLRLIGTSVYIWSYYYLETELSYKRFSFLLNLFILRILLLIFSSNLISSLIGWDLLGVTSFILVIYYNNRKCLGAGILTACSNRIGDCFFIILLCLSYGDLFALCLILVRMTKSAQFPFSSWLPSAMAAPTPVRALVHSSTLVTAGVYMMIRYCKYDSSTLLYLGSFTMIIAGLAARYERDIKKIVALRTLSQLGVMFVALGAIAKSFCFFHLLSHACFKALLFICVGYFIHNNYGTQDSRRYSHINFLICTICTVSILRLLGFFFTTGYFRKEAILEQLYQGSSVVFIFLFGIFLTTCYSFKLIKSVLYSFWTERGMSNKGIDWRNKMPLCLLAVLSVCFGRVSEHFINPCVFYDEHLIPIFCLLLGSLVVIHNNSYISSLLTLTPQTQKLAQFHRNHQKIIDKGWVERGAQSFSFLSSIDHSPAILIGLRMLFILYDQCRQCMPYKMRFMKSSP